jgi:cytochrome c peroxidase
MRDILRAEGIYRGLAHFLKDTDPKAYREVGLAWLQLTTAAVRPAAASSAAFDAAARVIKSYLLANVEKRTTGAGARARIWLPPDADLADQVPLPRLMLNFESRGIDEKKLFPVAYGDMLFDSPEIYGATARRLGITCAGCHNRGDINQRFFIPGLSARRGGVDVDSALFNPIANDHRFDPVDIPSLRGIRFTAPYGRDGRFPSLREVVRGVIVNEFGGPEPTPLMLDAMVAYLNEFDFLPAPNLRRDGRLKASAPAAARRGEVLFNRRFAGMGGKSCAGCHMPNANFLDGRRHDIGSVAPVSADARSGALDTPTLLGINYTAPYFHDGSLATLADVVGWFDKRFSLGLDRRQTDDLLAYLVAVGTGAEPYETFDDTRTPFRLAFEELSVFISTLDTLIPARDRFHAGLLIRTVARDLRADAPGMANIRYLPRVHLLADRLEAIGRAVAGSDWRGAAGLWAGYKKTERAYASQLY